MFHRYRIKNARLLGALAVALSLGAAQAQAQGVEDFTSLANSLTEVVDGLNATMTTLPEKLKSAIESGELATEYFDKITVGAQNALDALREDGEIWQNVLTLDQTIQANAGRLDEKFQSTGERRFQVLADAWRERNDRLANIRQAIIAERGRTEQLLDSLLTNRDYVIELIQLQMTDEALNELEKVHQQMSEMNNQMEELQKEANALAGKGDVSN